ncbi:hypothetical protein MUK42_00806 [Musa troglodytarum]|uniref:Uncharacterized protein n=1 Tax=Musa troglodytarum TaxID=320322 RepID=A0A9E7HVX0_9LILI|nr:hypothetical protein MUK42_00806 [Musa troglodytarum]URE40946.1 hypothetical protein MUK42_00806 [Musa troglodytarum]
MAPAMPRGRGMAMGIKLALCLLLCVGFVCTEEARLLHCVGDCEHGAEDTEEGVTGGRSSMWELEWRKREVPGGPEPHHHR